MAEIEPEEGLINAELESDENDGKKSFLKSKLFFIIIALIVLFIAVGGYYFFIHSASETDNAEAIDTGQAESDENEVTNLEDDELSEAESIDESALIEQPTSEPEDEENNGLASFASRMGLNNDDAPVAPNADIEDMTAIKQKIANLEAQVKAQSKIIEQQQTQTETDKAKQKNNKIKYSAYYRDDAAMAEEAKMRQITQPQPPKPSWGEFERINKK